MKQTRKIVVLGGGTGTFTVLSGLKKYPVECSAVVSVADNGGSTGILRDELGVLPPGDIRQCLVALSSEEQILRQLFTYRFEQGSLKGHNFGNIFLSALEKLTGDPLSAIKEAQRILQVKGRVIPVSARASNLCAELEDGMIIQGEHAIDEFKKPRSPIQRCFLSPLAPGNPEALEAIRQAQLVILGPGDLFTSLVPVLLVQGISQALADNRGEIALIMNLVTKPGQTDGYTAKKLADVISSYIAPARLDIVIINSSRPESSLMKRYAKQWEQVIRDDLRKATYRTIRAPLLSKHITLSTKGDVLRRSFLRHDPDKLAKVLISVLAEK